MINKLTFALFAKKKIRIGMYHEKTHPADFVALPAASSNYSHLQMEKKHDMDQYLDKQYNTLLMCKQRLTLWQSEQCLCFLTFSAFYIITQPCKSTQKPCRPYIQVYPH